MNESDEDHVVTLTEILEELDRHDIKAERKSVYDDIEALRSLGYDIIFKRSKTERSGYFLASREFELPELKLLCDIIQSSKFITHKKTLELIKKIEGLGSRYEARELQRQVYVIGRVKGLNEQVYYNVDGISTAINADSPISFRYFEYTVEKKRRYRNEGREYILSPFALIWDDENYYLLGWDHNKAELRHYRVDKMVEIKQLEGRRSREGKALFSKLNLASYSKATFGMFAGERTRVGLRFSNKLAGVVIDRFGKDVIIVPDGKEHFLITAEIAVSPQFYAWLFGFGSEVEIVYPEELRAEMKALAGKVARLYK